MQISDALIHALIMVESGGDDKAIGDKGQAFGCLQIWQTYMSDALPGKSAKECLGNRELSIQALRAYMARYATAKRLGRAVTDQDIARIHNGGPNGYRRSSTLAYWAKVRKYLP